MANDDSPETHELTGSDYQWKIMQHSLAALESRIEMGFHVSTDVAILTTDKYQ